ncbi:MAG: permease [Candidatus Omnitrophica bacterium]|nr:permease [Candidatus Omnitrophota bacterium]
MLEGFSRWVVIDLMRLSLSSRLGEALQFFIADSIKIIFLLMAMIFVIGVLRSYIPHAAMKRWMSHRGVGSYFFAAIFGAVTPFCSCSSIPIFFAFIRSGVSLGVSLAFLVTSPVINEYLFVLMLAFFGWKIACSYVASGILIGVFSGMVIEKIGLVHYLEQDMVGNNDDVPSGGVFSGFLSRLRYGGQEALSIVRKIWAWVLVGVALGAAIHNYVPKASIDALVSSTGIFSVPLAVLIGVPMYGSCAAIVPVAVALFQKGVPLGTALSFMMAVSALSLPEAVMLRRAMKLPLILIFFFMTTFAIIITGYLFNFLQNILIS